MGFLVLRRILVKASTVTVTVFSTSAARLLASRTYCTFIPRIPETNPSPWLMLPPVSDSDSTGNVAFRFHTLGNKQQPIITFPKLSLPEYSDNIYFAGSSLFVHNLTNHNAFMLNPITARRINLPSITTDVPRFSLSCSPDDGASCRAVISTGDAMSLAFCVPGRSHHWTRITGGEYYREYDDVVYSTTHNLFLCLFTSPRDWSAGVESWNISEPLSPRIDWRLRDHDQLAFESFSYPWPTGINDDDNLKKQASCRLKYLIESGDDLFVVVRHIVPQVPISRELDWDEVPYSDGCSCTEWKYEDYSLPYKTVDFDVYMIVGWRERGGVTYMKCSLDGLAMFVGSNHSFAVLASEYPGLRPNCIYYSDENRLMVASAGKGFGGHDNGIFDYQRNEFSSCCDGDCPLNPVAYLDDEGFKRMEPPPLWFAPPTLTH